MNDDENKQEDFIRVYDDAVSRNFCQGIIDYFEWCNENNRTWDRQESTGLYKKDKSASLNPGNQLDIKFNSEHLAGYLNEFNIAFWDKAYTYYRTEFDVINTMQRHSIFTYKVQKTMPGGGYHVWHCENGSLETSRRVGVYILYLNEVMSGGETEFLYLNQRIPPKEGRLLIFPSGFTHTHRGNPPLKGSKYIMTGWIELS